MSVATTNDSVVAATNESVTVANERSSLLEKKFEEFLRHVFAMMYGSSSPRPSTHSRYDDELR